MANVTGVGNLVSSGLCSTYCADLQGAGSVSIGSPLLGEFQDCLIENNAELSGQKGLDDLVIALSMNVLNKVDQAIQYFCRTNIAPVNSRDRRAFPECFTSSEQRNKALESEDSKITKANQDIASEEAKITKANQDISSANSKIIQADKDISSAEIKIADAKKEITQADKDISSAESKIENAEKVMCGKVESKILDAKTSVITTKETFLGSLGRNIDRTDAVGNLAREIRDGYSSAITSLSEAESLSGSSCDSKISTIFDKLNKASETIKTVESSCKSAHGGLMCRISQNHLSKSPDMDDVESAIENAQEESKSAKSTASKSRDAANTIKSNAESSKRNAEASKLAATKRKNDANSNKSSAEASKSSAETRKIAAIERRNDSNSNKDKIGSVSDCTTTTTTETTTTETTTTETETKTAKKTTEAVATTENPTTPNLGSSEPPASGTTKKAEEPVTTTENPTTPNLGSSESSTSGTTKKAEEPVATTENPTTPNLGSSETPTSGTTINTDETVATTENPTPTSLGSSEPSKSGTTKKEGETVATTENPTPTSLGSSEPSKPGTTINTDETVSRKETPAQTSIGSSPPPTPGATNISDEAALITEKPTTTNVGASGTQTSVVAVKTTEVTSEIVPKTLNDANEEVPVKAKKLVESENADIVETGNKSNSLPNLFSKDLVMSSPEASSSVEGSEDSEDSTMHAGIIILIVLLVIAIPSVAYLAYYLYSRKSEDLQRTNVLSNAFYGDECVSAPSNASQSYMVFDQRPVKIRLQEELGRLSSQGALNLPLDNESDNPLDAGYSSLESNCDGVFSNYIGNGSEALGCLDLILDRVKGGDVPLTSISIPNYPDVNGFDLEAALNRVYASDGFIDRIHGLAQHDDLLNTYLAANNHENSGLMDLIDPTTDRVADTTTIMAHLENKSGSPLKRLAQLILVLRQTRLFYDESRDAYGQLLYDEVASPTNSNDGGLNAGGYDNAMNMLSSRKRNSYREAVAGDSYVEGNSQSMYALASNMALPGYEYSGVESNAGGGGQSMYSTAANVFNFQNNDQAQYVVNGNDGFRNGTGAYDVNTLQTRV